LFRARPDCRFHVFRTEVSFIVFHKRYVPVDMNMKTITGSTLFVLFIFTFAIIPAAAYSTDAMDLYNEGSILTLSGNYTGAIAVYNRAVTLEPAYFEAWNGLADALNRNGQFNDALAASNRSLDIYPAYVNGWINRGQILYNIGYQYEDVAHDMVKADAMYAEQLQAFEKAVTLEPNNAEAWFNEGYALAGMKRYDEAIAAFDRVKVIDPAYPNLQKNREIAVQLLNKAGTPSVTTGQAGMATTTPLPLVSKEKTSQQQAGTPARPSPLAGETGIIALVCGIFLLVQRK
jgi:tetratricopeptide (TPR) repeat protein